MNTPSPSSPFTLHIKWHSADEFISIDPETHFKEGAEIATFEIWKGSREELEYSTRCEKYDNEDSVHTLVLRYAAERNPKSKNDRWGTSTLVLDFARQEFKATWDDDRNKKSYNGEVDCALIGDSYESRYPEGAAAYELHRRLERDSKLAAAAKLKRLATTGTLACDVCSFDFRQFYGSIGGRYIEAHHTEQLSKSDGTRKTPLSSLALVCSNCHRMLHHGSRLLSVAELRKIVQDNRKT